MKGEEGQSVRFKGFILSTSIRKLSLPLCLYVKFSLCVHVLTTNFPEIN